MSNSGKVWNIREAYKLRRNNSWEDKGNLGLSGGGNSAPSLLNVIDKINITVSSNSSDFGDLTATSGNTAGVSDSTIGLFCGGTNGSDEVANIDKIVIGTTGNASDFGDLTTARNQSNGCSNAHGGLS